MVAKVQCDVISLRGGELQRCTAQFKGLTISLHLCKFSIGESCKIRLTVFILTKAEHINIDLFEASKAFYRNTVLALSGTNIEMNDGLTKDFDKQFLTKFTGFVVLVALSIVLMFLPPSCSPFDENCSSIREKSAWVTIAVPNFYFFCVSEDFVELMSIVFFWGENLREKLIVVFDGILTTQICRFRWN